MRIKDKLTGQLWELDEWARQFAPRLACYDIEGIAKDIKYPDEPIAYLLDDCGNYSYIDLNLWQIID